MADSTKRNLFALPRANFDLIEAFREQNGGAQNCRIWTAYGENDKPSLAIVHTAVYVEPFELFLKKEHVQYYRGTQDADIIEGRRNPLAK